MNGDPRAPERIRRRAAPRGVASVREPQLNDERTVAIVFVTPTSAPQDEATDTLVDRLRNDVVPAATAGGAAVAYVSGQTAAFKDIADRIFERIPLFLLYIVGVTFIVLAMAFRSIVVSATAAVTTLLSAFVGFGVLGLVVQEGHLLGLTGFDQDGADRDLRPADCLRDPLRALDGLHGLPHEPHPGGARPRPADACGGRARHLGDRPGRRRRSADHGHGVRSLHPERRSHPEGIRAAARGRDSHRRADRAYDARARVPHAPGREVVVHPALARPAAPEHHDRVAARRRDASHSPSGGASRGPE